MPLDHAPAAAGNVVLFPRWPSRPAPVLAARLPPRPPPAPAFGPEDAAMLLAFALAAGANSALLMAALGGALP